MIIIIGSKNPTKIKACETVFPEYKVEGVSVASEVASQPSSDEETRRGAMNRAYNAAALNENGFGIGLEGGIMFVDEELYLCNWGALVTPTNHVYTASGARIVLPPEFIPELQNGKELGTIMTEFSKKENVSTQEGAVGIFTNNLINRSEMFTHVVKLLRGQWEYWDK